ncbi:MAG: hypothetical protein WB869_18725, partial [Candidatus Acidiferrales bacterium]
RKRSWERPWRCLNRVRSIAVEAEKISGRKFVAAGRLAWERLAAAGDAGSHGGILGAQRWHA